ncbi:MAG: hypothetical protein H0U67_05230 [Gemmatimonadetes bacterium]|nr:hypothetical protein [Gemmatimonadota bacterium]
MKTGNINIGTTQRLQLDGRIDAVRFGPDGQRLAVVTEFGQVTVLDCSPGLQRLTSFATELESCDLAFDPRSADLVVTGVRLRDEVEGAALVYSMSADNGEPSAAVVLETMVTAPTFVVRPRPLLLLGSYLRLVCADAVTFEEIGFAEGDDYVAPSGIVALPNASQCVVAWGRQGSARVHWYDLASGHPLTFLGAADNEEPEGLGGLAVSPSGAWTAATFARPDEFLPENGPPLAEAPYGHLALYDNAARRLAARHPIAGSLTQDFTRYNYRPGQRRERDPSGLWRDIALGFGAERPPSRPVFLSDNHVAFAMPGGAVKVMDVLTGQITTVRHLHAPVRVLDYSTAGGRFAVGCADGSVLVWAPDDA